jgi:hypothetical protein
MMSRATSSWLMSLRPAGVTSSDVILLLSDMVEAADAHAAIPGVSQQGQVLTAARLTLDSVRQHYHNVPAS